MSKQTFTFSVLLIALGLGGYFGSGQISFFPLIPAGFGVLIFICGLLALSPNLTKHAMHAAAMLALIGFVFPAKGIIKVIKMLIGIPVPMPPEAIAQATMSTMCLIYVILCFRWFLNNRKKQSPKTIG